MKCTMATQSLNIVIYIISHVLYKSAASNCLCSGVCHNCSTFFKCLDNSSWATKAVFVKWTQEEPWAEMMMHLYG